MITRFLEKLAEFLAEHFGKVMVSVWRKSPLRALVVILLLAAFLASSRSIFSVLALLPHADLPWSREVYLLSPSELVEPSSRIERALSVELARIIDDSEHDLWTFADIVTALPGSILDAHGRSRLTEFLINSRVANEGCWHQYVPGAATATHCHIAATAWAVRALVRLQGTVPQETVDFVINSQRSSSGWWPLYADLTAEGNNASTYATAVMVLSISELLASGKIDDGELASRLSRALERGRNWLWRTKVAGRCGWYHYPQSERKRESQALTGLVVYVLHLDRSVDLGTIHRECTGVIMNSSTPEIGPEEQEPASGETFRFAAGGGIDDHVRHYQGVWRAMGAASCVLELSYLQRARLRRELRRVLNPNISYGDFGGPWHAAEALLLFQYVTRLRDRAIEDTVGS